MKQQEFVTLYGKAIVERDVLFVRNFDVPFTRTSLFRIFYELCFLALFVLSFFREDGFKYVFTIFWGILFLTRFENWYEILIKRSYASRIPLKNIRSVTTEADQFGLNTNVRLHLRNGRHRVILFRTMEKQYEGFIEFISHQIAQPQFA